MIAGGLAAAGSSIVRGSGDAVETLPGIKLGDKVISRLVAGGNPIGGWSYGTINFKRHMLSYFTVERTTDFILHCEHEGITTWQSHYSQLVREALTAARERGAKIQWIVLTDGGQGQGRLEDVLSLKPIAVCHHGGVTDRLFSEGNQEKVHDFIKRVHDEGVLAGVSTHNPDNLARVEDSGWENDFYMACFYHLSGARERIRRQFGEGILGSPFFESDPQRMTARIRQVKKPCLGFKILAAGRLCSDSSMLERAFAFAYSNIKSIDGVIVGMFPVFTDEIHEDAALAGKYAKCPYQKKAVEA